MDRKRQNTFSSQKYDVNNLISGAICSECTDFCLQLCFGEEGKPHSQNLSHFENESTFIKHFENESTFKKNFLKRKAHLKKHFENESTF